MAQIDLLEKSANMICPVRLMHRHARQQQQIPVFRNSVQVFWIWLHLSPVSPQGCG